MEKWIQDRLSTCLDFEVPDDMIKYIMTLKSSEEFDEYFASLLNPEYDEHRIFMVDCKQRLFSKAIPNKKAPNQNQQQSKNPFPNKKQDRTSSVSQSGSENAGGKKKNKFVNLFSNDGKVPNTIMLKGRRPCVCEATEHKLVNNCLGCGRIVCEQEGSGPCLFCGELVCSNEEMLLIKSSTKKGDHLRKTLQEKGGGEGLRKALEQRDRLLEYDRNGEKRTEVIDDESDYFQLLDIVNGIAALDSEGRITLQNNFFNVNSKNELIQSVFPSIKTNYKIHTWLSERAIMPGTNKNVSEINATILNCINAQCFAYKSVDPITNESNASNYQTEFLNSLDIPGL